jgi:hypothetical protein
LGYESSSKHTQTKFETRKLHTAIIAEAYIAEDILYVNKGKSLMCQTWTQRPTISKKGRAEFRNRASLNKRVYICDTSSYIRCVILTRLKHILMDMAKSD